MVPLSIIVPVYNKEKYIESCIKSILSQTFNDFELILINDGSSDGSGLICDNYQKIDQRIKVIHQNNAGVSMARNVGLNNANGEYIGFIDSDDTIDNNMYELLMYNITKYKADISVCRMRVIYPHKTVNPIEDFKFQILDNNQGLMAYLRGELDMSANNKIYISTIAKTIQFEGSLNEDILYTARALSLSQNTINQNVIKYNYIIRDNSASMSFFSNKYMQMLDVSSKIVELAAIKNADVLEEAMSFDVVANISMLNLILLTEKGKHIHQYQRVVSKLNSYSLFISESSSVKKKHKYAFKIFSFSPYLYQKLMHVYCYITNSEVIKRI